MLAGAGHRCTSAASFRRSWGDLPLRKPSKGRDLGLESALNLANVGSHSRHSDRGWSGAGLIDRRRSGRLRLITIILAEVHDFAGDLRAVFAVCVTPRLLAVMIIGS